MAKYEWYVRVTIGTTKTLCGMSRDCQCHVNPGLVTFVFFFQLQVVSICLLEELIASLDATDTWLPIVKQHSLLECLLASGQVWIQVG